MGFILVLGFDTPAHAVGTYTLKYTDEFGYDAPLGTFSDCDHNADTVNAYCTGTSGHYRNYWWAYPNNWPDTAKQRNYPVGGYYSPEDTIWVSGGQMHLKMYRGLGNVHSATVVPKYSMNQKYGQYIIKERVSHVGVGYKTADLLWPTVNNGCTEVDYPELEHDVTPTGFFHPQDCNIAQSSFSTGVSWSDWHVYAITWTPSFVHYWCDGVLVGSQDKLVPNVNMSWDIQNESALNGEQAAPNSYDQIDIEYVKGYSWSL
jgi:hypothetical protein